MPLCVHTSEDGAIGDRSASVSNQYKTISRRYCCGFVPYSNKKLSHLRKVLEYEYSRSSQQEYRQALSLINGIQSSVLPSELSTLTGLLSGSSTNETINSKDSNRSSYSIQCKRCQSIDLYNLIFGAEGQENFDIKNVTPTALHVACLLPNPGSLVNQLTSSGAQINLTNQLGQTPLHALILGDIENDSICDAFNCLISNGALLSVRDNSGDTPLLYVRNLLRKGLYKRATQIAHILLKAGSNPEQMNVEGRTLLTYSVQYLDDSFELTKFLLNNGCSVWGTDELGATSAFSWLLKTIMLRRKLVNCHQTMHLICQLMREKPSRMKLLVGRVMMSHTKCYQVYGPLFKQLKSAVEIYWRHPMSLMEACRASIRSSLQSVDQSLENINIPVQIKSFLLYDNLPYLENC